MGKVFSSRECTSVTLDEEAEPVETRITGAAEKEVIGETKPTSVDAKEPERGAPGAGASSKKPNTLSKDAVGSDESESAANGSEESDSKVQLPEEKPAFLSRLSQNPKKYTVDFPRVFDKVNKLKAYGTLLKEEGTNFWFLHLNDSWQNSRAELLELIEKDSDGNEDEAYKASFGEALKLAESWAKELTNSKCGFYTPTSLVDLHISLGTFEPESKPKCLVEGNIVNFSIKNCSTVGSNWPVPRILPCQRKFELPGKAGKASHFATQWFMIDVVVKDFDFQFHLPPHISIGCYGVMFAAEEMVRELSKTYTGPKYEYGKIG